MSAESIASYVVFTRGQTTYAIPIDQVRRVVPRKELRDLPASPEYVVGGMRVDEALEVLVDLAVLFEVQSEPLDTPSRAVLVAAQDRHFGLLADDVEGIVAVEGAPGKPPPFIGGARRQAVAGVLSRKNDELLVLDLDRMLSSDEFAAIGP